MRYAEIIVDLSAGAVDRLFTYAVPEGMEIGAGWQVEVPFGPRTLEGFVVSMKETCDLPPEKVRSVRRAVRDYPVILPELLDLAVWMHERYLCKQRNVHLLSEVLAAFLAKDIIFVLGQLGRREPRHVLHEAEQWHVHLFVAVHVDALACISERYLLRRTYNDGSRNGQRLQQGEMNI